MDDSNQRKFTVVRSDGGEDEVSAYGWKIESPGVLVFYIQHYPGEGEIVRENTFAYGTTGWRSVKDATGIVVGRR